MTVEERAKEYADNYVVGDAAIITDLLHKVALESYQVGSTDQQKIDDDSLHAAMECEYMAALNKEKERLIEKACKLWHKNILKAQITEEEFRQAMEEKI